MSDFVKRFKQQAMGKLDSYLQKNVDRAYELNEALGDVAAGGAAVSSAMADTLLPDSATDLLPVGKLTKGVKKMGAIKASTVGKTAEQTEKAALGKAASMMGGEGSNPAMAQMREALRAKGLSEMDVNKKMTQLNDKLNLTRVEQLKAQGLTRTATPGQAQAAAAAGQNARQMQEAGSVRARHVPGQARKLEEDELAKRLEEQ